MGAPPAETYTKQDLMFAKNFAALTPLKAWPMETEMSLPCGVRVERLGKETKPEWDCSKYLLSGRQSESLCRVNFWLVYDFSDELIHLNETKREAMELVRNTSLAYQVVRPVGTDDPGAFVILCERTQDKLILQSVDAHPPLDTTPWGKTTGIAGIDPTEFSAVVEGVHDVMRRKLVRLRNPLYLLELGLQTTSPHIGLLLWVAALDALLMAGGESKKFVTRLSTFLGNDAFVFPAVETFGQPKYRVGQVAEDLYKLRSAIAHGNEIPAKFRKETGFLDCAENLLEGYESGYRYGCVLLESALFLLCAALRKVFVKKLIQTVAERRAWRSYLKRP